MMEVVVCLGDRYLSLRAHLVSDLPNCAGPSLRGSRGTCGVGKVEDIGRREMSVAIAWGPSITVRHPALPYTLGNNVLFHVLLIIIDYFYSNSNLFPTFYWSCEGKCLVVSTTYGC